MKIDPRNIEFIEKIPQERVRLRRSNLTLRIIMKDGSESIILMEIQTVFSREFVLRLIDYTVHFMLIYNIEIVPFVILFKPSSSATGLYEDKRISFRYEIIRLWEKYAPDLLDDFTIYPFFPLMLEIYEG